jgi:putative SOS response-associated peptidase YedK
MWMFGVVSSIKAFSGKLSVPFTPSDGVFRHYLIKAGDSAPFIRNLSSNGVKQAALSSFIDCRKAMFKSPYRVLIRTKRCLIPATHLIAVSKTGQAYCIYCLEGKPFFLAGIWDSLPKDQLSTNSFHLLTCSPNSIASACLMEEMPIILPPSSEKIWLSETVALSDITALLHTPKSDRIDAYPISSSTLEIPSHTDAKLLSPVGKSYWKAQKDEHEAFIKHKLARIEKHKQDKADWDTKQWQERLEKLKGNTN